MKTTSYSIIAVAFLVIGSGCHNSDKKEAEIQAARQAAIDSVNNVVQRERMIDSMNRSGIENQSVTVLPPAEEPKINSPHSTKPHTRSGTEGTAKTPGHSTATPPPSTTNAGSNPAPEPSGGGGNQTAGTGTAGNNGETGSTAEKKKKGIPTAVKGAVIGAGAGAVGGAVIDRKNPGKGAVIGGIIGAGAGAATGIILDKKKKKNADSAATHTTGSTTK